MNRKLMETSGRTGVTALLIICAVAALTPTVWLIAAALKSQDDMFHYMFFPPASRMTLPGG